MDYTLIVLGFLFVLAWQVVSKTRETRQRNRWMRTHVGPGLGLDPEQTEDLIEQQDRADAERFYAYQGKP